MRCSNGLPTCERLDDEHRRAAVNAHEGRADLLGRTAPGLLGSCAWRLRHEQLGRLLDAIPSMGVGQQPVVPDAVEPVGQDVQQEAAHVWPARVLEIGFGLGIPAELIQRRLQPAEHHIVEIDTGIYADLVRFAGDHRGVLACLGDWRSVPLAAPFDLVFYDPFDYTEEPDDAVREAGLLRRLVGNEGALCHPHFGDGPPRVLPGFRTVVLERFTVPKIDMADGTHCEHAAAVLCYPED